MRRRKDRTHRIRFTLDRFHPIHPMKQTILVIDDEPQIRVLFKRFLEECGYDVQEAPSLASARKAVALRNFDAALIDQMLPDGSGIDVIPDLRAMNPDMAIVVITGRGEVPLAVEAMRRGADNFLTKPVELSDLELFLRKSLDIGSLRRSSRTRQLLNKKGAPLFGESIAMRQVVELAKLAADNNNAVLLSGETGVGKGVLARWIHESGARRSGAFVEVNCSSLRGELLASELFGHAKGSFTSAVSDCEGLLDAADNGTLFLDEIGDMDPAIQSQFLKVVEEKSYRRLGEVRVRKSDFQLICASNKDLLAECSAQRFRRDLYYRIQVLPIRIPSLKERPEDISGLAAHILKETGYEHGCLGPEVQSVLHAYPWPGNIRELKNVLERAVLLAHGKPLSMVHLPGLDIVPPNSSISNVGELSRLEEDSIKAAIQRSQGDINKAAKVLGISLSTIYRKIRKYGIPQS